jgi:hypothetical protein
LNRDASAGVHRKHLASQEGLVVLLLLWAVVKMQWATWTGFTVWRLGWLHCSLRYNQVRAEHNMHQASCVWFMAVLHCTGTW